MTRTPAPIPRRPPSWAMRVLVALALPALLAACASRGGQVAGDAEAAIDLERFMGRWHVVAHVPDFSERGHVASSVEYGLRGPGEIGVRYAYRTGFAQPPKVLDARAAVREGSGNRQWRVWLFRVLPVKSRVLEVAPDYAWALVDYPGRNQAWILAREAVLDDALYQDIEKRMRRHGVNTDKMRRVPQVPAQVGKLGFADPGDP